MPVGVAVRTPGAAGWRLQGIVISGTPEVDVEAIFVTLLASPAYSVLPSIGK